MSRAGRVCLVFIGVNICSSCRCCAAGTWIRDERRKELWQLQLITTTITAIGGCWGKFLLPGKTFLFTIQRRGSGPAHRDARQSHAGFRTLTKWMKTCCFAHTHTSSYVCGHAQIRTWMRVHTLPLPHSHTNNQSLLWADTSTSTPTSPCFPHTHTHMFLQSRLTHACFTSFCPIRQSSTSPLNWKLFSFTWSFSHHYIKVKHAFIIKLFTHICSFIV